MKRTFALCLSAVLAWASVGVHAKLPAPSDEAKAKAAEAAAKTAYTVLPARQPQKGEHSAEGKPESTAQRR